MKYSSAKPRLQQILEAECGLTAAEFFHDRTDLYAQLTPALHAWMLGKRWRDHFDFDIAWEPHSEPETLGSEIVVHRAWVCFPFLGRHPE